MLWAQADVLASPGRLWGCAGQAGEWLQPNIVPVSPPAPGAVVGSLGCWPRTDHTNYACFMNRAVVQPTPWQLCKEVSHSHGNSKYHLLAAVLRK